MKLEFYRQIFEKKYSRIIFLENPSSGSRVIPCGRMDRWTDGQTDRTKVTVAFCNFTKASQKQNKYIRKD